MSTRTERDIIARQAGHFRQTEPSLDSDQEKCMIAPTEPGALIWRRKQRLDLRTREKVHLGPRKPLTGNGQHTLDLGGVCRRFECGKPKKGVDGSQPQIAASRTATEGRETVRKRL